ncbi:MAG: alpha/beta hydrolase [Paracoccaceae bacterium]
MFDGFSEERVEGNGATLFVRHGGKRNGPGVVLLHGYPQTSAMWHGVAPLLADDYHVICPDLRGYGRSDKPESDATHAPYSKRAMASDICAVMERLGHKRFLIGAHDRGARVAHRLGIDTPDAAIAMTLLDIAPTREMYANTSDAFARAYWHWFFLIQPAPFPEEMILQDPEAFWRSKCSIQTKGETPFIPEAQTEYLKYFQGDAIHAMCEDYRAAATIDIAHDDADKGAKLTMPLQVYWGSKGIIGKAFDPLALWQTRAENVSGHALDTTHYMAEERPDQIATLMRAQFEKAL